MKGFKIYINDINNRERDLVFKIFSSEENVNEALNTFKIRFLDKMNDFVEKGDNGYFYFFLHQLNSIYSVNDFCTDKFNSLEEQEKNVLTDIDIDNFDAFDIVNDLPINSRSYIQVQIWMKEYFYEYQESIFDVITIEKYTIEEGILYIE